MEVIKIELRLNRETPGTFVYNSGDKEAVITSLYLRKAKMPEKAPETITITIEPVE